MNTNTNDEKLQIINTACALFGEAAEKIRQAKALFCSCGIEFCDGFNEKEPEEWLPTGNNLHIYRGMKKLEEITGATSYFPISFASKKLDTSFHKLKYNGLVFIQSSKRINI